MKRLHKYMPFTPDKEDKIYFLEMVIFLTMMIFCIAGIVYLGMVLLQSNIQDAQTQLLP